MPFAPVCMMRNEADSERLSEKISEETLAARGFEPLWGKIKASAFVSKADAYYVLSDSS